jgi:hypothetical protein
MEIRSKNNARVTFTAFCMTLFAVFILQITTKAQTSNQIQQMGAAQKNRYWLVSWQLSQIASNVAKPSGVITGLVSADSGRPIAQANVSLLQRGNRNFRLTAETDEKGQFRFDNLPQGVFLIYASAAGYYLPRIISDAPEPTYKPGNVASIMLAKGSVITGKVTDANGKPMIGVSVRPTLVRDWQGKSVRASLVRERQTDDQGTYRLYGLEPGAYLVSVGGNTQFPSQAGSSPGATTTYHPSETRDTATEIPLAPGAETTNINIIFRDNRGYAVSGSLTGSLAVGDITRASIMLAHSKSGTVINQTAISVRGQNPAFSLYGVEDGEYDLLIRANSLPLEDASFAIQHIKVKGKDVTGLSIPLVRFASIAGNLQTKLSNDCKPKQEIMLDEVSLIAIRDKPESLKEPATPIVPIPISSFADEKGQFALPNLVGGIYRLETGFLDVNWYVKSITVGGVPSTASTSGSPKLPNDVSRKGIVIKPGDKIRDLTVVLASGASLLQGRITPDREKRPLNRVAVHFIPLERELADEVLRYVEVTVANDGSFTVKNLAPGRYGVVLRMLSEEDANSERRRPAAWDEAARANLRREAEVVNQLLTIQPCQQIKDYLVPFALLSVPATSGAADKKGKGL